ncbi:nucleoside-diphosphate sugar epimerase [Paenibacillus silvae]|jgi:uncharacterized protein Yka (UPF0111/DUF47 family)|uniref:Nucleoside-diphosphate sugar epimerase n=2 Tax=Paenibacillus TaxID=44249 RepID=A0A2V4V6Y3_PAEBA|nr:MULTISPECIES: nucleoside-diphosphate sugar epimerase [Paenibacillus]MBU5355873.1 nucleoside-diphosphate sugar epimerase [Paenibacillus barcinonensis]MDM5275907.1 nucleoside-diphosphate sugar epimerase [Paenibacillus silvae]PYE48299.1 hypothetical protein DFQ00_109153 [Paenibacillus barcinonensis]QKS56858.1 nucleoside-diphosphate sugar epimerase [Paenibacillus barcinonensis]GGH61659.1 hypothetical protein GCM10008014_37330 [Paenibacillus silvae]
MQSKIDEIITHIAHSHQQIARVLDAKRQVAVRMSEIIHHLPDIEPELDGVEGLLDSSGQINKSIISYLGGLADLEEAVAETLTQVMREIAVQEEE